MTDAHCSRAVMQKLLTESLPEREETVISNHLSTCPECRRDFETLAADGDWWTEASSRLGGFAERRAGEHSKVPAWQDDDLSNFSTDFAVDFLEPSDDDHALGRLGEYEISEVIGRGGMGIVLKGFQKELHRHVAVKVLSPHLAMNGAARRRFDREARATAAVVHPHVMAIHSVNSNAKLPYLVMPLVPCQSLQERLDQQGPLHVKDVLRIGMQAASGLAAAHAQGLVHRDVKPANILLETNVDRVLLTDFGLARAVDDATVTRTGIIAGTPQYMSPEQANGDVVDRRSDLFSLGGVLYAMCTGRPPFRAETTFGILRKIRETSPRAIREINTDIPEWLDRIVTKLLAKDAEQRFQTAQEVASLLEQCLAHVQQPTTVPLPAGVADWPLLPGAKQRSRKLIAWAQQRLRPLFSFTAGAIVTVIAWIAWPYFQPHRSSELERTQIAERTMAESPTTQPIRSESAPRWDAIDAELNATQEQVELLETSVIESFDGLNP